MNNKTGKRFILFLMVLQFVAPLSNAKVGCFSVLVTAHENLQKKLIADDAAKAARVQSVTRAEPVPVARPKGSILANLRLESDKPVVERTRIVEPMTHLQRAVHDRLFIVQDFLLYAGDHYHDFMRAKHNIEPSELESGIKRWIDDRFQSVVRSLSRDSMREDILAKNEAELNDVAADIEALTVGAQDEVIARYKQHEARLVAEAESVRGLGVVDRVVGVTNPGVVLPDPLAPRDPPARRLVPLEWVPQYVAQTDTLPIIGVTTPAAISTTTPPSKGESPLRQIIRQSIERPQPIAQTSLIPSHVEILDTGAPESLATELQPKQPQSVVSRSPAIMEVEPNPVTVYRQYPSIRRGVGPQRPPLKPVAPTGVKREPVRETPDILTLPPQNVRIFPDDSFQTVEGDLAPELGGS